MLCPLENTLLENVELKSTQINLLKKVKEIALRYEPCKLVKRSTFSYKVRWYVLTEKLRFRWIGASMIYSFFSRRLGLLHVCCWKRVAFGEYQYGFEFCGGTLSEKLQETRDRKPKSYGGIRSNQLISGT